jgi:hypothetical protein
MLSVSLEYSFLIASSVFSNVYLRRRSRRVFMSLTDLSNSEKLATLGTQDKGRIQTTQKTKTHPTKNRWATIFCLL